jgi:Kef-type K+ transport system membrane component KefB/nucleotide-binding universal stress UspA family protein
VPGSSLLIVAAFGGIAIALSSIVRRFVPEIVVFLLLGVLIGPEGFAVINGSNIETLNVITEIALAAIIFLIGDRLRIDDLRNQRRLLAPLNLLQLLASSVLVFVAMRILGIDVRVAAVLALIAAETGVLTVTATMKEERAAGPFSDFVLSSVALSNVAVAALFGLTFPFILLASGEAAGTAATAQIFLQIVVASCVIGLLGGLLLKTYGPAIETSGELLLFLLIVLTGVTGAAMFVEGSVVVAALVAGLYVANAAPWMADRFFAAVRTLEAPIYLIFFIVAGADIHLDELAGAGLIGGAYVIARTVGKVGGSALGAVAARRIELWRKGANTGLALLPHAGMAIALTAFVSEFAPDLGAQVTPVVLGSIVVFELSGPLVLRRVLRQTGEAGKAGTHRTTELPDVGVAHSLRKVLIPVSSGEVVIPRLPFLFDLVGGLGAEVVAVHISQPSSIFDEEREPDVLRVFREVAEERGLTCTTVHRQAEPIAHVILDVAREVEADLIVMGEPARTSVLEPTRWGLVSQRVVRDARIPVLVYPVDPSNPEHVPGVYLRRADAASSADNDAGLIPAQSSESSES